MTFRLNVSRLYRQGASLTMRLAALVAVAGLTASAHASNLIADSGFESAGGGNVYYAGQSIDGGSWTDTLGDIYIDNLDPYVFAGNNAANLTYANLYVANSLSQTIATTPGQEYFLSFLADSDTPNSFSVTENGIAIAGLPSSIVDNGFPSLSNDGNSALFVDLDGEFIATSTSTQLTFTSTADPAFGSPDGSVMIDNVSLTAAPEPSSMLLALTGVLSFGIAAALRGLRSSIPAAGLN